MRLLTVSFLAAVLTGCSVGESASAPTTTPTRIAVRPQSAPTKVPRATPTVDPTYAGFVRSICRALAAGNAAAVTGSLMYYQYNSGLYWGMLGGGEGQTSDPSLMGTWLAGSHVRCVSLTPSLAGHGTLLTTGWARPGPASLIEMDTLSGHWKINDFTFGSQSGLARAMQVGHPILPYTA